MGPRRDLRSTGLEDPYVGYGTYRVTSGLTGHEAIQGGAHN